MRVKQIVMLPIIISLVTFLCFCGKDGDDEDEDEPTLTPVATPAGTNGASDLLTLVQCNEQNSTTYSISSFMITSSTFKLPYPNETAYEVSQGYFGTWSHDGIHALDFLMPQCSEISAIAAGRVIRIKEDSNIGGTTNDFAGYMNYVTIDHGNGQTGVYGHLCNNCALVAAGALVDQGQVIALSGHTGWSTAPHLHFQMNTSDGGTIETQFSDPGSGLLSQGNTYASQNNRVEGSGTTFSGSESEISADTFTANGIATLSDSFSWYQGLQKEVAVTLTGTVTSETTNGYIQAFLMDKEGNYLDGAYSTIAADKSFAFSFTPAEEKLPGTSFLFALATKQKETDGVFTSVSVPIIIKE